MTWDIPCAARIGSCLEERFCRHKQQAASEPYSARYLGLDPHVSPQSCLFVRRVLGARSSSTGSSTTTTTSTTNGGGRCGSGCWTRRRWWSECRGFVPAVTLTARCGLASRGGADITTAILCFGGGGHVLLANRVASNRSKPAVGVSLPRGDCCCCVHSTGTTFSRHFSTLFYC